MSASLLGLLPRGRRDQAAPLLTGVGLGAATPTAATGFAEWERIPVEDRASAGAYLGEHLAFGRRVGGERR